MGKKKTEPKKTSTNKYQKFNTKKMARTSSEKIKSCKKSA